MTLTGARFAGKDTWMFYKGGEDAPTRTMAFSSLQFEADGSAVGALQGVEASEFRFVPATPEAVRASPAAYGLTPAEAAQVRTLSDVYLYVHASRVPDWYDEVPLAVSEARTVSFQEARGEPAPVGAVHFWDSRNEWYIKQEDGSWRQLPENEEWRASHPGLPQDSLRAHTSPDGTLFPERQRLHARIIDSLFRGKRPTRNPTAVITMGLPASGKSSLTRSRQMRSGNFVLLDADDHREHIPEYQAAKDLKARNGAAVVHNEVSEINDRALERAMADNPEHPGEHYSFVLDGVGGNLGFYQSTIEAARRKGYDVALVLAHVRDQEDISATDLVKIRAEQRGRQTGRFVVPHVVDRVRSVLPENFNALSRVASSATVVDVTDPDDPREMYSLRDGEEQGNPRWVDEAKGALSLSDLLAVYKQAVKDDAASHAAMPVKYGSGEGVEDPLLDPVKIP